MEQNEIYVTIQGYSNYEISNIGSVRNVKTGRILKSITNTGYYTVELRNENGRKIFYIHRLIAIHFITNPNNLPYIDHIDGNTQNNSILNLRWCNKQQNAANSKKQSNTSSIYKGVTWNKSISKWKAQIMKDGKNKHLGLFDTEREAARIYNEKANEYFGEFANLNVI